MLSLSLRCLALAMLPVAAAAAPVQHELQVELTPEAHRLRVTDRITLPAESTAPLEFTLHAGLAPRLEGPGRLLPVGKEEAAVALERFRIEPAPGARTLVINYGGVIYHPLADVGQGVAHAMETTPGLIGPEGVILGGESGWYPQFGAWRDVKPEVTVALPAGWQAISQGEMSARDGEVHWRERSPQEEIWLVAGPMTRYQRGEHPAAMVFLRTPDPALAETYLAATDRYLRFYSNLIGPYAYPKFAAVENFWETGYGMPSFTLLGSRVIRLPFLLESSYPHEILHNWWGNGVYVDPSQGNWSEGLTAYLADHLLKEQAGHGADYRRDQLQAYSDYVSSSRDFPLAQFSGRHSGATQAIGYGKGMMFFHMLRRELGDAKFMAGLRRFYKHHRFAHAGFSDLRADFEAVSGKNLGPFFAQWVERPGAPAMTLADAHLEPSSVKLALEQSQADAPFQLMVPVVVTLDDGRVVERTITMK